MSYLEHSVKSVPAGLRKILYLNWPLTVLLIAVASIGFLMLYSVAGGSFTPWAEPQMKRFVLGMVVMIFVAMVPIWFWRNMAVVAYGVSVAAVDHGRTVRHGRHGRATLDRSWLHAPATVRVDENHPGDAAGSLL